MLRHLVIEEIRVCGSDLHPRGDSVQTNDTTATAHPVNVHALRCMFPAQIVHLDVLSVEKLLKEFDRVPHILKLSGSASEGALGCVRARTWYGR